MGYTARPKILGDAERQTDRSNICKDGTNGASHNLRSPRGAELGGGADGCSCAPGRLLCRIVKALRYHHIGQFS